MILFILRGHELPFLYRTHFKRFSFWNFTHMWVMPSYICVLFSETFKMWKIWNSIKCKIFKTEPLYIFCASKDNMRWKTSYKMYTKGILRKVFNKTQSYKSKNTHRQVQKDSNSPRSVKKSFEAKYGSGQ